MKRLVLLFAAAATVVANAQQNIGFRATDITSPVVNDDHTVTFLISAPKAKEVTVRGDWEADGGIGKCRKVDGVWQYTTPPLPS